MKTKPIRWTGALAALVAGTLFLTGCVVHDHGHGHVRVYGPPVVIGVGHVHTDSCGHYSHGGRWYHAAHHRHGPRCGHTFSGGIWIVAR
jgi:hypothetical protein